MKICLLSLLAGLLAAGSLGATTIQFEVSNLGTNGSGDLIERYTYFLSDVTLSANEELDIQFNPAQFGMLSNGVAGSDFDLLLVQPNNAPGTPGFYSALSRVDNPSLSGPFSVDFTLIGSNVPGPQPFSLNQFDQNGRFVGVVELGTTSLRSPPAVPEPAAYALCGMGLVFGSIFLAARRLLGARSVKQF